MYRLNSALSIIVCCGLIGIEGAFAQTPASPSISNNEQTITSRAAEPDKAAEVEKWTTEQWEAAKAKWAEERAKWADCQQLATDQKLTGRKSWAFLYGCMT
jgi:hypothetical protein